MDRFDKGAWLRAWRLKHGETHYSIAKKVGFHPNTALNAERGVASELTYDLIAERLGIDFAEKSP